MPPESAHSRSWGAWAWSALFLWSAVVLFVCVRSAVEPRKRSLYPTWSAAGANWLAGQTNYGPVPTLDHQAYRYPPPATPLLVPLALLPERLGNVLWRLLNVAALLGGLAWWLRCAAPRTTTTSQQAIIFLLVLPLALSSASNGQPNLLLVGLLLSSLAATASQRWNVAVAAIALATAFKGYPLALGLLLAVAYPRVFVARLGLALGVVVALPFVLQSPAYVAGQYAEWFARVRNDASLRRLLPEHLTYRDLWLLLQVWHVPISEGAYLLIQGGTALGCALVVALLRWRGWSMGDILEVVLVLGTSWMVLCGPATESSTYVLLAPALAWWLVGRYGDVSPSMRFLAVQAGGLFGLCVLAGLTPSAARFQALGLQPLATLLLLASYLGSLKPMPATGSRPAVHVGPAQAA